MCLSAGFIPDLAADETTIQNGDICIIMSGISLQRESSTNTGVSVRKPTRAGSPQEGPEGGLHRRTEKAEGHSLIQWSPFWDGGVVSYLNIQTGRSVALRSLGMFHGEFTYSSAHTCSSWDLLPAAPEDMQLPCGNMGMTGRQIKAWSLDAGLETENMDFFPGSFIL